MNKYHSKGFNKELEIDYFENFVQKFKIISKE
jgi:hypothetical protein